MRNQLLDLTTIFKKSFRETTCIENSLVIVAFQAFISNFAFPGIILSESRVFYMTRKLTQGVFNLRKVFFAIFYGRGLS